MSIEMLWTSSQTRLPSDHVEAREPPWSRSFRLTSTPRVVGKSRATSCSQPGEKVHRDEGAIEKHDDALQDVQHRTDAADPDRQPAQE